jgi:biofilm protein TabA
MIVGLLSDVAAQKSILPAAVVRALEALQKLDLAAQEPGRYELEGDKLFYMIQDVMLRSLDESRAEAHHKYADIQIPLTACERYGFSLPQADLAASEDLLDEKDLAFYPTPANESFMDIEPGGFAVFMPRELHRPCLAIKEKSLIRKAVVKIHVSLLGL